LLVEKTKQPNVGDETKGKNKTIEGKGLQTLNVFPY